MDLVERIIAAMQRVSDGHALMRIPPDESDADLVLADCKDEIERLRAEVEALRRDAKRYQLVAEHGLPRHCPGGYYYLNGVMFDSQELAIDAAISEQALQRMTDEAQTMGLYDVPGVEKR